MLMNYKYKSMPKITESEIENFAIELLEKQGI